MRHAVLTGLRSMTTRPRLAVAMLAAFVAGGLVPRAAVVTHDHAGGGAPHVHALPHSHDGGAPHVHAGADEAGAALTRARHTHRQSPFQHVDRVAALPPLRVDRATPTPPVSVAAASDRACPTPRSRGPPPILPG